MIETLPNWVYSPTTTKLLLAGSGLLVIVLLTRLLRGVAQRHLQDNSTRYQASKAANFGGWLAAALLLAAVYSDQLGGLTVAFGVAGAGVAFALQEVIASVAGWVAVSFGGFYRVGDRVQLGGIKGDVIDIGILRTTIMQMGEWVNADQYNGRIVRVANSFVFKEPVFNYSGEFPFLWDEVLLPLRHGSDVAEARRLILAVAETVVGSFSREAEGAWEPMTRRYLIEKASVQPMLAMAFDANGIQITLRYVVDYKSRRVTKDRLYQGALEAILASNGRVAVAAATLDIELMPALQVNWAPASTAP